ncbi:PHB depolymerase family esterase [Novosphingobium sp. P6W]|uniref:extracellular catalytic domain type 1 short-chain-length polyhydroxyalkanoate depolymerase n=1 Tax=Novosphingobium sp. P6W TaxID=1609758 RepID=UPI000B17C77C|nr:PHB depolymerase family esterase [Novosphingobium sp. P6W]
MSALVALQGSLKPATTSKRKPPKAAVRSGTRKPAAAKQSCPAPGSFITDEFHCSHGKLSFRFYTPRGSKRRNLPLVVMMHGCSQTASDFAVGTGMNALADELGCLVLYPQQSQRENLARCWNWHRPKNQSRGQGEPALISALTRHAIALGNGNPKRVYIAGISAGGTAAAIIGAAYPSLFTAVGVHSGVARGNIRTLPGALAAMRGESRARLTTKAPRPLPTIVFHGDGDRVVHPSNAAGFLETLERSQPGGLVSKTVYGKSGRGRDFTRKVYRSANGEILLEDWTVHGSGHGWSGGNAFASYTDPTGPDASREMLRFFLSRQRA